MIVLGDDGQFRCDAARNETSGVFQNPLDDSAVETGGVILIAATPPAPTTEIRINLAALDGFEES